MKKYIFNNSGNIIDTIKDVFIRMGGFIKFHCHYRPLRRKMNKHNNTELVKCIPLSFYNKIKIGNYTYGHLDIRLNDINNCYIEIGNYCSIAPDVKFICGLDHNINHFSTYPFGLITLSHRKSLGGERIKQILELHVQKNLNNIESISKGPIIVDDDVWIGTGAKIMSGVHVGQGAVIGAGAVVTKDIPPYAIVGGVPAKVIKYRFDEDKIKKLLKIDYSKIPIEKFREIYDETIKDDFDIDKLIKLTN